MKTEITFACGHTRTMNVEMYNVFGGADIGWKTIERMKKMECLDCLESKAKQEAIVNDLPVLNNATGRGVDSARYKRIQFMIGYEGMIEEWKRFDVKSFGELRERLDEGFYKAIKKADVDWWLKNGSGNPLMIAATAYRRL